MSLCHNIHFKPIKKSRLFVGDSRYLPEYVVPSLCSVFCSVKHYNNRHNRPLILEVFLGGIFQILFHNDFHKILYLNSLLP